MIDKPPPRTYGDLRPAGDDTLGSLRDPRGDVGTGFALGLLLHLLQLPIMVILGSIVDLSLALLWSIFWLSYIGVTQIIYMGPAVLIAAVRGKPNTANGLLIAGIVTSAVNVMVFLGGMRGPIPE